MLNCLQDIQAKRLIKKSGNMQSSFFKLKIIPNIAIRFLGSKNWHKSLKSWI